MSVTPRTAEIAGGGIAGLTAAAALAARGWGVRVHERASDLREIGAGIYLKENSIRVLSELGILAPLMVGGVRLSEMRIKTADGLFLRRDVSRERTITVLRERLHSALGDVAQELGAKIVTRSRVESAHANGRIVLNGGRQSSIANLVVAADGINSRIRNGLGLTASVKTLPDGASRMLIRRTEDRPWSTEHWSGRLRVGVVPCAADVTYVYLIAPEADLEAVALPVVTDYWSKHFPDLQHVFDRIEEGTGTHHAHGVVRCTRWHQGRVAILGDAAHAQPPNLGQGAGLAIANAWALAESLDRHSDVVAGLEQWERNSRPLSDAVQRWSCTYGRLGYGWPSRVPRFRSFVLRSMGRVPMARKRWVWLWRGGVDAGEQETTTGTRSAD